MMVIFFELHTICLRGENANEQILCVVSVSSNKIFGSINVFRLEFILMYPPPAPHLLHTLPFCLSLSHHLFLCAFRNVPSFKFQCSSFTTFHFNVMLHTIAYKMYAPTALVRVYSSISICLL